MEQTLIFLDTLALATVRCLRCRDNDPTMTALRRMLEQRYGKER
jgi:hypothetical protein